MRALFILSLITISFFNHSHAQNYWSQFRGVRMVMAPPMSITYRWNGVKTKISSGKQRYQERAGPARSFGKTRYSLPLPTGLTRRIWWRFLPTEELYRIPITVLKYIAWTEKQVRSNGGSCPFWASPVSRPITITLMPQRRLLPDGQHVYVYFGMIGLYCYDMEGNKVWEKDLGAYPNGSELGHLQLAHSLSG
jgi:hypothetical protein